MKAKEIILESYMSPKIRNILEKKGYKYLGQGIDQVAYLAPDGMVLKIFGTNYGRTPNDTIRLTHGQKAFKIYADYCRANRDNPFLPNFTDWTTFRFEGRTYLQIKMERLFPFREGASGINIVVASYVADWALRRPNDKEIFIKYMLNNDFWGERFERLIMLIGREGFDQLWDTIIDLEKLRKQYRLGGRVDLRNPANFLLGEDGQIVITDPFWVG